MRKYIFISIPRNASHSISKILNQKKKDLSNRKSIGISDNHARCAVIKRRYGVPEFNKRFKFCFVRNPWDRCVSWFFYHRKMVPYNKYTFEKWVKAGMPHHWTIQNGTNYRRLKMSPLHQSVFFIDGEGKPEVNYVGRIENFEHDMKEILTKLDVNSNMVNIKLNRSNRVEYRKYYTEETKNIVARILKRDIELFKYEF